MKKQRGITLIALIITIIIMLILVGVSVTVALNGGLFRTAKEATVSYKKSQIEERVSIALQLALEDGKGELTYSNLNKELTNEFGEEKYTLLSIGKGYIVIVDGMQFKIDNAKIQYIENDGNNSIELAGDLSKGGKYNGTTEELAYRIMCIEDLVELTNNTSKYKSSYIVLERTLDFENPSSYNDYLAITTDINGNEEKEPLIQELTSGTGFKPISGFTGTFDGNGNEIRNLYQNTTVNAGFFGTSSPTLCCNLGITGEIKTTGEYAGGIIGNAGISTKINISNCYNLANVESSNAARRNNWVRTWRWSYFLD